MKRRVRRAHCVLRIAASRSAQRVQSGYSIAGLELHNVVANRVDNAGDVIALIERLACPFRAFPKTS